mmetsp:Transcript_76605/g.211603  ORF Transcript_76605/g.211603 Transcript_76605/m.211603 type:complete len:214 (+) Transcript_76605:6155-6796(+)
MVQHAFTFDNRIFHGGWLAATDFLAPQCGIPLKSATPPTRDVVFVVAVVGWGQSKACLASDLQRLAENQLVSHRLIVRCIRIQLSGPASNRHTGSKTIAFPASVRPTSDSESCCFLSTVHVMTWTARVGGLLIIVPTGPTRRVCIVNIWHKGTSDFLAHLILLILPVGSARGRKSPDARLSIPVGCVALVTLILGWRSTEFAISLVLPLSIVQ